MKNNAKLQILSALFLCALLLLGGCIRRVDSGQPAGQDTAEETVLDRICAPVRYSEGADGKETAVYRFLDGTLIGTVDEEFAAYYAEVIVPDDPQALFLPVSQMPEEGIPVSVRRFSGFSALGEYWDEPDRYRMKLKENALVFTAENGGKDFTRTAADNLSPRSITEEKGREIETCYGTGALPAALAGSWTAQDDEGDHVLIIREDGGFIRMVRPADHPVRVYVGACRVAEDGILRCLTEQLGWAEMPFEFEYAWEMSDGGPLILRPTDSPTEEIVFTAKDVLIRGCF